MIANPDAAKLNRNMAIANLVLAGIDIGAVVLVAYGSTLFLQVQDENGET